MVSLFVCLCPRPAPRSPATSSPGTHSSSGCESWDISHLAPGLSQRTMTGIRCFDTCFYLIRYVNLSDASLFAQKKTPVYHHQKLAVKKYSLYYSLFIYSTLTTFMIICPFRDNFVCQSVNTSGYCFVYKYG